MPESVTGTVILVEDDASTRKALSRILRLGGFAPMVYGSAEALLDDKGDTQANCMILDVQLPGIDGFELHDRLRARGIIVPAIFITAFDYPTARAQAARLHATLLAKPFAGRALLEAIRATDRSAAAKD